LVFASLLQVWSNCATMSVESGDCYLLVYFVAVPEQLFELVSGVR